MNAVPSKRHKWTIAGRDPYTWDPDKDKNADSLSISDYNRLERQQERIGEAESDAARGGGDQVVDPSLSNFDSEGFATYKHPYGSDIAGGTPTRRRRATEKDISRIATSRYAHETFKKGLPTRGFILSASDALSGQTSGKPDPRAVQSFLKDKTGKDYDIRDITDIMRQDDDISL